MSNSPVVVWWSRAGRDYSRDRIVRQAFEKLGWKIDDFCPRISSLGDWQARFEGLSVPQLVWVPCFRQRDAAAAIRWGRHRRVPVVLDPLISAYDKQVFERQKFDENSTRGRRLLRWEQQLFQQCDIVIADTDCHADFFKETLQVSADQLAVIPVGAEEGMFLEQLFVPHEPPVEVLFYGSFIGLQGPEVIAQASSLVPEVSWTFIGEGPLKEDCLKITQGQRNVKFLPWQPYQQLPQMIGAADILLGVFGGSRKAGRVIPNKVYQALACGRVVVTRESTAYPKPLQESSTSETGIRWVPACSPEALADAVRELAFEAGQLPELGHAALKTYQKFFSDAVIIDSLEAVLKRLKLASVT